MTAWTKLLAQAEKDHGTRGAVWGAVMAAEGNGTTDAERYDSLCFTVIFEENADVRAYFESIGYAF
jgi:hypothetical protein